MIEVAALVGLPAEGLPAALERQEIKDALRVATASAWEQGVAGVPSIQVGGEVVFGDDRLEDAAKLLR